MKTYIKSSIVLSIFLLIISTDLGAQIDLVKSRFIESGDAVSTVCANCMPDEDGIVHMRFKPNKPDEPDNVRLADGRFTFTVQVRKTGSELPYSNGTLGIEYNTDAFGERLNTPPFSQFGIPAVGGQCTYTRGADFATGSPAYTLELNDSSAKILYVQEQADGFTLPSANADSFITINDQWQDYITLSCLIEFDADGSTSIDAGEGNTNADSGVGLTRNFFFENQIWDGTVVNPRTRNRTVLGLADNDLRGYRLDGKTWAEDYARFGDGMGVRLKFSKGIATKLTADHFAFDTSTATISSVNHTANSPYATILFDRAVTSDILRITTASGVPLDEGSGELANGNFVAALEYDADAPRVTGAKNTVVATADNSQSTWELTFSAPIDAATFSVENLCITDADTGACPPPDDPPGEVHVESVLSKGGTTATIVIDEGAGDKDGTHSIEFKRNAVLGTDYKVVEDYQGDLRDVIEVSDTKQPTIGLTAERAKSTGNANDPDEYNLIFNVTADENVPTIDAAASYLLVRVAGTTYTDESQTPVITVNTAGRDVTLTYTLTVDNATRSAIDGFTVARASASALVDGAGTPNTPVRTTSAGGGDIGSGASAAGLIDASQLAIFESIECAAVYHHIGQQELFFKLEGLANDGTFTIDGTGYSGTSIGKAGDGAETVRVTLSGEITSAPITVQYTTNAGTADVTCSASLTTDADEDGIADIADGSPFGVGSDNYNTNASATPLLEPAETSLFYSRSVIIRSLLEGGNFVAFDYVTGIDENDEATKENVTDAMSAAVYFGISSVNAELYSLALYRSSDNLECVAVLAAADDNNLTKVNLDELCGDVDVTDKLADEPMGTHQYVWADKEGSRLKSHKQPLDVKVLPEVNFVGQSSYLYIEEGTKTVDISTDANELTDIRLSSASDTTQISSSTSVLNVDLSPSPIKGQTITYWLGSSLGGVGEITCDPRAWCPNAGTEPTEGGHPFLVEAYAVGANNNIDVRVAADDEEATRIRDIRLYEFSDGSLGGDPVTSVQAGNTYVLIAYLITNIEPDVFDEMADAMLVEGYEEPEVITADTDPTIGDLRLDANSEKALKFTVTADAGTITVGWSTLGTIEDVRATYLITTNSSELPDNDYDRVPNMYDLMPDVGMELQVDVMGNAPLRTTNQQDLFASDEGLIIALNRYDDGETTSTSYSAANIAYSALDDTIKGNLRFPSVAANLLDKVATFGVKDVIYAIDGGGTAYITFPMEVSAATTPTRYLAKHKRHDNDSVWYLFERANEGTDDTWYAIERPDNSQGCPTDIRTYRANHQAHPNDNDAFMASDQNCIMLVITDGHFFDGSSIDGRVIDPVALTPEKGWLERVPVGGPAYRGGGGGAIGISDVLLLLGALTLLMVAGRKRRIAIKG